MNTLSLTLLTITFFASFFGCKKEKITTIMDAVTVHDTVCIEPSKQEILTQKVWQIDELYRCYQGVNTHYVRGGVNTTGVNYFNMRFTFTDGGTGTYVDETSTPHTLDWSFTGTDYSNASLSIGPPYAATFTWNLIEIRENYLHSTSLANVGGNALLLSARYVQIP